MVLRRQDEGGVHHFLVKYDEACRGDGLWEGGVEGGEVSVPAVVEEGETVEASPVDEVRTSQTRAGGVAVGRDVIGSREIMRIS